MPDTRSQRTDRRFAVYAIGAAVLLAVMCLALARTTPSPTGARITWVCLIVCGSITMVSAFHRSRNAYRRRSRAWFVLSFGAVCGVAANLWALIAALSPVIPDDWYHYADPLLLAAVVFCVTGLVLFPNVQRRGADVARMVLDGLVIGGSLLFVTSVTIFPQLLAAHPDSSFASRVQALALPVLDVLIATLATLLIIRTGRASRVPLVLLGAGFLLYAVSDQAYAVLSINYDPALGTYIDLGWVAGYLLFSLAARHPTAGIDATEEWHDSSPVLGTILLFSVFLAATGFSLSAMLRGSLSVGSAVVWVVVILGLIGRQVLLVADNQRLRYNLEGLVRDRTRELRGITKQRELLLTSVGDGIYGVDRDGLITFVNRASARILRRSEEALIGQDAHALFHAPQEDGTPYPNENCYITEAIRSGITSTAEEDTYVRGDDRQIVVEATASPLSSDEGISGAVVVFRDVSERHEVDRMKNEFVSIVSHELRTPLTSIRGSLGLVAGGAFGTLPPKAARMLDIALVGSDRLTRLINDILDIERIQTGTLPMDVQVHDARVLCDEAISTMAGVASASGITIVLDECVGLVRADRDRIVQTLINLLGNAVKFSPPGSVVRVSAHAQPKVVEFAVTDQGRGIPADKLEAIFTRFTQVDSSDAREKGGTGLGLAISRTIVERLGGRIWAESELGRGSVLRFTLPRETAAQEYAADLTAPTVVVCDDDPDIVEVLSAMLDQHGYRPIGVTDGAQAVEIIRTEQPDAVLLDLWMPGTSGAAVVAALRADQRTAEIPIVMVSGMRPASDPRTAADTDGWVQKPVDEQQLFTTIAAAIDQHHSPGAVLVVEDDDALARVLQTLLARRGLTVSRARGQDEALQMLADDPPQVLVLDLGLPDGSGFDVVATLRAEGQLGSLPMVVYSATDVTAADRDRLSLGETVFLTKGRISPQQLENRVVELIDRVTGHRAGHHPHPAPQDRPAVAAVSPSPTQPTQPQQPPQSPPSQDLDGITDPRSPVPAQTGDR